MALLKIKLPGQRCSSQLIEDVFYRKYPYLRRLKLKNFKSLEAFASIINVEDSKAFNLLVNQKSLHGIEWLTFIFVHPDGIIDEISKLDRKLVKKLRVST